jgi:hypothetical protein
MIVWINGAFGVGKTTTTTALVTALGDRARAWDPEYVGSMLTSQLPDVPVADFQDWPAWRKLVVATGAAIHEQTGQLLVAPQTVVIPEYVTEIFTGFAEVGIPTFHVVLDASPDVVRQRALDDPDQDPRDWRLERLADYLSARAWLTQAADLVVNTDAAEPAAVVQQIVAALAEPRGEGR